MAPPESQPVRAAAPPPRPRVLAFALTVKDLSAAEDFFGVLGFELGPERTLTGAPLDRLTGVERACARTRDARLGDETIILTSFEPRGKSLDADASANDTAFQHLAIVVADVDAALAHAESHLPVERVSSKPQTIRPSGRQAAAVRAVYLRDPEGHFLELIAFPPGKGNPRWHRADAPLFRGIDHSALATRDSDRSLTFYRDRLGFRVEQSSLNQDAEQSALSGVPGARVKVTSLAGGTGPGIELLEYLAPRDGAPLSEPRAPDIAHWETIIEVVNLREVVRHLPAARGASADPLDVRELGLGYGLARSAVDPDGHAVRLVEGDGTAPAENPISGTES